MIAPLLAERQQRLEPWNVICAASSCPAPSNRHSCPSTSVACSEPSPRQRRRYDPLRLSHHLLQVFGAPEALGVDLVDILGARRPGGCLLYTSDAADE